LKTALSQELAPGGDGYWKRESKLVCRELPAWKYKSRTTSDATFVFYSIFHTKYVPKPLLELKDTIRGKYIPVIKNCLKSDV